jgi:hypothetical protein
VGKPEGKRPLGRPRRRWEDGIRMNLRETSWGSVEWIQLVQDRGRWRFFFKYGDEPSVSGATALVNPHYRACHCVSMRARSLSLLHFVMQTLPSLYEWSCASTSREVSVWNYNFVAGCVPAIQNELKLIT